MTTLQIVLAAICALVAVWLVVLIVLDRLPGDGILGALVLIEVGLVVQLVLGLVQVFGDHGDLNVAAYVGYLVGSLLVLPIGFVWSAGERTRSGTADHRDRPGAAPTTRPSNASGTGAASGSGAYPRRRRSHGAAAAPPARTRATSSAPT